MILFLDIDGVIVTARSHYSTGKRGLMKEPDMTAASAIRAFCMKASAMIVVSSTWRRHEAELTELLHRCSLGEFLYPVDWGTPTLGRRGEEIQSWLDAHPHTGQDYIILEDEPSDLLPEQHHPKHLIKCDVDEGMTSENIRTLMKRAGYYKN